MARRRWKIEDIKNIMAGENPFKQFGYNVVEVHKRKIGKRWTDARGKTWEQRDGYRVIVNEKADQIRDLIKQECSRCGMDMKLGNRHDHRFFKKSGMCYDCTILRDTELMATGKWKNFERLKTLRYQLSYVEDIRTQIKESIDFLSTTDGKMHFVDQMGGVETWTNTNIDILLNGAKQDYEKLTKDIEELKKMISDTEAEEKILDGK
jgi:hypothetical protein